MRRAKQVVAEKYRLSFNLESPVDLAKHLILPVGTSRRGGAGGAEVAPYSLMADNRHQSHTLSQKVPEKFMVNADKACCALKVGTDRVINTSIIDTLLFFFASDYDPLNDSFSGQAISM